jgi:hypothetical protein
MKKALFTIALAVFAFAANAQFVVGGHIGYNTDGASLFNENVNGTTTTTWTMPGNRFTNTNTSTLTILPKIGYNLNDKMQVGASFGLTWEKTVDYSAFTWEYRNIADFEGWQRTTQAGIKIAPYFRYNLTQFKGFTLFCEAQLAFTFGLNPTVYNYNVAYTDSWGVAVAAVDEKVEGVKDTYTDIALTVVPGLNYKFSNKFSADIYIDLLGLGFSHRTEKVFNDWNVMGGAPAGTPTNTTENVYNTNEFYLIANANAQTLRDHLTAFRLGFNYHF